jgi:hypothetical protein
LEAKGRCPRNPPLLQSSWALRWGPGGFAAGMPRMQDITSFNCAEGVRQS